MKIARFVTAVLLASLAAACTADGKTTQPTPAPTAGGTAPAADEMTKIEPSANYPLKVCLVTGEALGGMGPATAWSWKGREVQFCCDGCVDDFRKDPAPYLAKLDAAKK